MKHVQIMLAGLGTIAMIVGTALIIAGSVHVALPANHPGISLPGKETVYVGTNACFTCHNESRSSSWYILHPQSIQSPLAPPPAISEYPGAVQSMHWITSGVETHAHTANDISQVARGTSPQRYVMKTETGLQVVSWGESILFPIYRRENPT